MDDAYPQYDDEGDLSWRDEPEEYLEYDADEYFYDQEDDQNEIAFSDSESNPQSDAEVVDSKLEQEWQEFTAKN